MVLKFKQLISSFGFLLALTLLPLTSHAAFSKHDFGVTAEDFYGKFSSRLSNGLGIDLGPFPGIVSDNPNDTSTFKVNNTTGLIMVLSKKTKNIKEITAMYIDSDIDASDAEKSARLAVPFYVFSSLINITTPSISSSDSTDIILSMMLKLAHINGCGGKEIYKSKKYKYTLMDVCSYGTWFIVDPL